MSASRHCPDCDLPAGQPLNRRQFVQTGAAAAAAVTASGLVLPVRAAETPATSEQLVAKLYESLTPQQRGKICFAWDHQDGRGLLRTHVSNNWYITDNKQLNIGGSFYTADQRDLIEAIFFGLYSPDWHPSLKQQLTDDAGGFGTQSIAIFGQPGAGQWQFVMTGRHLTIRCDGDSADHVAFGGPIFYGHDPNHVFDEQADHPGNVYWHQALKANKLFEMLDGKQRETALISTAPGESEVAFRGAAGGFPGIPISELSADQQEHAQGVLKTLLEPYRLSDRDEALQCLERQGGLGKCSLAFYRDEDIGADGIWDIWRIEGPSFVWHYRGAPHVHVWVNIADDPSVPTNAAG